MPATKKIAGSPDYKNEGELCIAYYRFLDQLWRDGSSLRADLTGAASLADLKALLKSNGLIVPEDQIVLVDVAGGTSKRFWSGPAFDETQPYYVMILPPSPSLTGSHSPLDPHQQAKAWSAALYHAQAESYGM